MKLMLLYIMSRDSRLLFVLIFVQIALISYSFPVDCRSYWICTNSVLIRNRLSVDIQASFLYGTLVLDGEIEANGVNFELHSWLFSELG